MNSSTLVCCISNVAVDQLLNKIVDVMQDLNLRECLDLNQIKIERIF